jgi:hypothetical protein
MCLQYIHTLQLERAHGRYRGKESEIEYLASRSDQLETETCIVAKKVHINTWLIHNFFHLTELYFEARVSMRRFWSATYEASDCKVSV